jgi:Flp pilus assembly protein TadB
MTRSDLFTWRKRAPVFIFGVCLLPWVVLNAKNLDEAKLLSELVLPVIAVIAGFFYVGLDISRSRWKSEQEAHVGKQIREALIDMVPKDLGVTESEKKALAEREVFRDLTGVFWEAVDGNQSLRSLKEHFFSNGIVYSISIDVYLICGFFAFLYAVASLLTRRPEFAYVAILCVSVALLSRFWVTPTKRKRHLELSAEQLELLRREQSDFVSRRFRDIIIGWRCKGGGNS